MKIIHYFLGFPPYRSGGSVKYVIDLSTEQVKFGHDVSVVWPGVNTSSPEARITYCGKYRNVIKNYELITNLPVSLVFGIREPSKFIRSTNKTLFLEFLQKLKPDIIHLHTLMGLPKEFLSAAKELGIKTIYTTHDYFGLCPKARLFYHNNTCFHIEDRNFERCAICNLNSPPTYLLTLYSIPFTHSFFFKRLAKGFYKSLRAFKQVASRKGVMKQLQSPLLYENLFNHYMSMFEMIDLFHYNSTISEKIFKEYLPSAKGQIIPITNSIVRKENQYRINYILTDVVKLAYAGGAFREKGFEILVESLRQLWFENHRNFKLILYGDYSLNEEFIIKRKSFRESDLSKAFEDINLLVVPSLWYETFSLLTVEAISYGIPVLVSDRVGAKDVLMKIAPELIVKPNNFVEVIRKFLMQPELLYKVRNSILNIEIEEIDQHAKQILQLYKQLSKN